MNPQIGIAVLLAAFIVFGILGESFAYRRYTGLKHWQSVILGFFTAALAGAFCVYYHEKLYRHFESGRHHNDEPLIICASIVLLLVVVPFVVRLYNKLIGGQLTEAEKQPGMDGIRAWLGVGNVLCATLIPVCAWLLFGTSMIVLFTLTFGLLLAYPAFNIVSASPQPAPVGLTEDLTAQREKVLQLLETGKITADESAELLNALGHSVPPRPSPKSEMEMTPQRKIVLLGAVLLLVGFMLPWFVVNPGAEANIIIAQLQENMKVTLGMSLPQMNLSLPTGAAQVHAGDLSHGLGWWILMLGIGAAGLPFFATNIKPLLQKKLILAALVIGAFLLIYYLSLMDWPWRNISFGFVLSIVGYALEFVGTLKERPLDR